MTLPPLPDLREALLALLKYAEINECQHDETHRGGVIWTICDGCGRNWADDRNPFKGYQEPAAITNARAALAAVPAQPVAWMMTPNKRSHRLLMPSVQFEKPVVRADWELTPLYAAPQAVPVPADMALTDDPWRKLYRRAINEANGLTNYVEDRPELRGAERRLAAIEAEARTLAATFEPTPEKKP